MESENKPQPPIKLGRQLITCVMLCTIALVVIYFFHRQSLSDAMLVGLPITQQIVIALAVGLVYALAGYFGFKWQSKNKTIKKTVDSYSRLDLNGLNPIWISICAGVGEEFLFRAAVQPLIGIWLTSIVFVLAHARAYQFKTINIATFIQASSIFAISVFLGLIFQYVGLIAAILIHTMIDVVGLYSIRHLVRLRANGLQV